MIKILDTSKALETLVSDNTNGLGQIHPLSAIITEELNGIYEAELSLLATDQHFPDLSVGGILKMPVNETGDEQLFRIYSISKPIDSVCSVLLRHISYDLNKVAVKPFTATGAVAAKNGMLSNLLTAYPVSMTTDIDNSTSKFKLDIPRSFRECLGGYEGSLLDVFRGEYEWDNLTVKMLARRGADNGVRISYGKNLTDFKQEENNENTYTAVLGYAVVNDTTYTGEVYHKISATYPKVKIVDFTEDYDEEATPTTAQLTAKAQRYAEANSIEIPKVNIDVSFVPLYQTEEYKDIAPLERVSLGDTVHVYFDKMGVEASARVIKTEWNALLNRYESVEIGDAKANLTTVINEVVEQTKTEVSDSQGFLTSQMNQMASLIINGLGLHRTLVPVDDGGYRIYLHNKETLAESDTQYIFTAEGFLVSTDYGQTWNAGFDSEGNAVLNSLATITLKALEIYGSTITFGDIDNKYITAGQYTLNGEPVGISFDGNGYVRFRPVESFSVYNKTADGTADANRFLMDRQSTSSGHPFIQLYNNDTDGNVNANFFEMDSDYMDSSGTYNRYVLRNNNTDNNTSEVANTITMRGNSSSKTMDLTNFRPGTSTKANGVRLVSTPSSNQAGIDNLAKGSSNLANSVNLYATETTNYMTLSTYDGNNTLPGASIQLSHNAAGESINLLTYIVSGSTASSNAQVILNGGNISLYPGSSGRVTIGGSGDSIHIGGHTITFSDGYVRYT